MTGLVNVGFFCLLVVIGLTIFIKIFINERKVPMEQTEQQNIFMDFILRSIYLIVDTTSILIFWFLVLLTGYIFVLYKLQNQLTIMIPITQATETRFN
jgi:Ca2+/Na+ antiporter